MSPDVAASVRARLLNKAKQSGEEFERTLARFAGERLLFRLGPFEFDGAALEHAVAACFERRHAPWTGEAPRALTPASYHMPELMTRWRNYLAAGTVLIPPPAQFADIGERITSFLGPVRESILDRPEFEERWEAGGPWRPVEVRP